MIVVNACVNYRQKIFIGVGDIIRTKNVFGWGLNMTMQQIHHPMQQDAIPYFTACTIAYVCSFNVQNLPSLYKINANIKLL